jgi:ABC-type polysaccharide/polyol phosphate transport system ATPase subunit
MMSDLAIRVENLSKQYILGGPLPGRHDTLRDTIVDGLKAPAKKINQMVKGKSGSAPSESRANLLMALNDVSFEVKAGEVIGIIGHNGAGKSTLLKILSRITEPTSGRAIVYGRVGSLLEVGTGFHPELTGRENIFLNGAILGMGRVEITRKFDEIVAFAEIEKFLDTPVKRYSSGMYVRLAFAVAAHLEPEILLVDEVLAVGDAEFQKKCLGKMDTVAHEGRTILFVSHNMNAIQRLCARSVLMKEGRVANMGKTVDIIPAYLSSDSFATKPCTWIDLARVSRGGTQEAHFSRFQYTSGNHQVAFQPYPNGPLDVQLAVESDGPRTVSSIAVTLYDSYGTKLVNADTIALGQNIKLHHGTNMIKLRINQLFLNPGHYVVGLWMSTAAGDVFDHIPSATRLEVVELVDESLGSRPRADGLVTCTFDLIEVS